jgi:cytochrome c biogenesis protein
VLLQGLTFSVELKKFVVECCDTGMPKLFASDIVIHDHEPGEQKVARVEVSHPASHRGINIYQSSFDDGGSKVVLQALPLNGLTQPFEVSGVIGSSAPLTNGSEKLTLAFTGLRVINVENFSGDSVSGTDVRKVDLRTAIESRLGSGHKTVTEKVLSNVGPSISYKLRDASGPAVEYNNDMLPIEIDGVRMYLLGMRETPADPMRCRLRLRVPWICLLAPSGLSFQATQKWPRSPPKVACRRSRRFWKLTCPSLRASAPAMGWCASSMAPCSN